MFLMHYGSFLWELTSRNRQSDRYFSITPNRFLVPDIVSANFFKNPLFSHNSLNDRRLRFWHAACDIDE